MTFMSMGCGHSVEQNWCEKMCMPCSMQEGSSQVKKTKLHKGSKATCEVVLKKSGVAIFQSHGWIGKT